MSSMPLRAPMAWRRNCRTGTPDTSWGYWKARKMPARPRSSGPQSAMSSPLKRSDPPVTTYSGLPISVDASVDFPDPLGPIRACTSPAPTVRVTPRRMSPVSRPTEGSAGAAWRSSISKRGADPMAPVYLHYPGVGNVRASEMRQVGCRRQLSRGRAPAGLPSTIGTSCAMHHSGPCPRRSRRGTDGSRTGGPGRSSRRRGSARPHRSPDRLATATRCRCDACRSPRRARGRRPATGARSGASIQAEATMLRSRVGVGGQAVRVDRACDPQVAGRRGAPSP